MFTVDLHLKKETISTALYNLKEQIKLARATKEKIICFIVGYGSTGGSHKIRNAVLEQLKELKDKNQIKDYILGSNIDIFNEKFQNLKGKELLDEDCKKKKKSRRSHCNFMRYDTEIKDVELVDAEPKDIPDILQLIYEIASYEKLTHEVTATLESLHESLFVRKRAHVILAKYQNKTIGYMLYFFNFSTFVGKENLYLEDLFVLEQYRHMGIGKALFKVLAKVAVLHDCKRIDWVCLNWNEPSLKFYQSIHAKRHDEWTLHRLSNEDILELAK